MSFETYQEYQDAEASEKIILAILEPARRLVGAWAVHAGSVYVISISEQVIDKIEDSGVALSEAASIAAITAGEYFHDRQDGKLYLETSDSADPNTKFLVMFFREFFANVPVRTNHDLSNGFDVEWQALIKGTSEFGVKLDNQEQFGLAIEGAGSISFHNDQSYWKSRFDKLSWENKRCFIYSWNRDLTADKAELMYRGRIKNKRYSSTDITFGMKDFIEELRAPVSLTTLDQKAGASIPDSLNLAFQRRLYGYVNGHIPTPIDQVVGSFAGTGTITLTNGSTAVTGVGTSFLSELSPEDQIVIAGFEDEIAVESITSDTALVLTDEWPNATQSGVSFSVIPASPKRFKNREFLVAGHATKEPSTTVTIGRTTSFFDVADASDLLPGDELVIGSELGTIERISGNSINLSNTLLAVPSAGTSVTRPSVSQAFINDQKLIRTRDYTYDAATAELTLTDLAEFNITKIVSIVGTVTFTSASRSVTGSGTFFTELVPGDWIRAKGEATFFEILSIESDTALTLRTASSYSATVGAQVKNVNVYDPTNDTLSVDVIGKTADGTKTGVFLKKGPQIVEDLLKDVGLDTFINSASFTTANDLAEQRLGLKIPDTLSSTSAPTIRNTINRVNQSIFGSLIQNTDFELEYNILTPRRQESVLTFREPDVIAFSVNADASKLAKTINVTYNEMEYDASSGSGKSSQESHTTDYAEFLVETKDEKTRQSLLVTASDAEILARRFAFFSQVARGVVSMRTKLRGAQLQPNDQVSLFHQKLYERVGSSDQRKVAGIQEVKTDGFTVNIKLEDLSNSFSRCAVITGNDALAFNDSSENQKATQGYITSNSAGMLNDDPDTNGINLIW